MTMLQLILRKENQAIGSLSAATVVMTLILMLQIFFTLADATQFVSGGSYVFSVQSPPIGQNYNYLWTATDGLPQTSIDKSFSWTAPKVTEPTTVEISLQASSGPDGCIAESKLSVLVQPSPLVVTKTTPAVTLIPNMETTFTITVENIGKIEIHDIKIVDELSPMLVFIPPAKYGDIVIQHTIEGDKLIFDLAPLGPLEPGNSWAITYKVKLSPEACSELRA